MRKYREGQRDGFSKIREGCDGGFVQTSKRKTCKRLEMTDGTTNATRSKKFDVLKLTESGLEVEEVNAVDVVQEIVRTLSIRQLPRASGRSERGGVTRTKATKTMRLAAASGSPIREEMRDSNSFGTGRSAT